MVERYDYVIVGAGMAADAAVAGIRRRDRKGSIAVVGEESFPPYQRPPLSKKLWTDMRLEEIFLKNSDRHQAVLLLTSRVTALEPNQREIVTADGRTIGYGKLLLATGSRPRRLYGPDVNEVYYVGSLAEHVRLHRALSETRQVAVVGGGFIGAEMAAALSVQGHQVTWVVRETYPFEGFFPRRLAEHVVEEYLRHRVTIAAGQEVEEVSGNGGGVALKTNAGTIAADLAVVGIGVSANDSLAESVGLSQGQGIVVDQYLRTADPHIWAAGDAVVIGEGGRLMMHEDHALTQGRAAGENMAGGEKPYNHVPFFYSDLYHFGYEAIGECSTRLELVEDWVAPGSEGVVYYLEEDRVRGVLNWNVWDGIDNARQLIQSGETVAPADLIGRIRNG